MDLCRSASLESAVGPRPTASPTVLRHGEIYESAGVVFWQKKCCVTVAGRHEGCCTSRSRTQALTLLQGPCCEHTSTSGTEENHISTNTLCECKSLNMTQHISRWELLMKHTHCPVPLLLLLGLQYWYWLVSAMLLVLSDETRREFVTRHPQLLAA